jgi:hypothetical protein
MAIAARARSRAAPLDRAAHSEERAPSLRLARLARRQSACARGRLPHSVSTPPATPTSGLEARGAFGGFIGPQRLLALVQQSAAWLFEGPHLRAAPEPDPLAPVIEQGGGPLGWWRILRAGARLAAASEPDPAQRSDYFALCVAAHFASAATYVPTDVDTKIRAALWQEAIGTGELPRMRALALATAGWRLDLVSARQIDVEDIGILSGHDGERLSVLCGGLVASEREGDAAGAVELEAAVDAELAREARAFAALAREPGHELDLLRAASVLTHNAGDVMQGLAGARRGPAADRFRERFGDLARERGKRYAGSFARAAALYRRLLASEGHRNYPLRKPQALRRAPELLLPIAPFFDTWGETLATTALLSTRERAEIVEALAQGCEKLGPQQAYYRALAGFARAFPRGLEAPELLEHPSASTRKLLRAPGLRQRVAVPRASFESSCAKRAREVLRGTSP